jgi:hypothetical protein
MAMPALGVDQAPKEPPAKVVDVAICLDVSNSMDGLIGSAKKKLWDIVNELGKAKPAPRLRVALFSYGNTGYDSTTGWVRKDLDLTDDLDMVSEKLFGLKTRGGNEYVARVCRDAVDQLQWSNDPGTLKIIFVCGNEPADQDKTIELKDVAEKAVRKGIVINSIYCGRTNNPEAKRWQEFAVLSEGRFACIDQDSGTVAIATPVDKELADLSDQLNKTYAFYGKDAKLKADNQAKQDANATLVGAPAAAARAVSKGSGVYRQADADLVDKLKEDPHFDVKKVPEDQLPDDMKKMTPEQREKHVKELLARREGLQKRVSELAKKREEHIEKERKQNPTKADQAFDEAVRGAIREQAKKKGIDIPK